MKNNIYFIVLIIMLCFGCDGQLKQKDNLQNGEDIKTSIFNGSENQGENQKWMTYFNLKSDSLAFLYEKNSIKIFENGEAIIGNDQIGNYLLADSAKLVSIKSDTVITANEKRAIDYEISENIYSNGAKHKTLVIWQTKNHKRKRVLEFTSKIESTTYNSEEIDSRRDLWMSLCNQHDAKKLIQELYSRNTLYFNHKPLIKGRELVTVEYQYMNNEEYQLSLQPEIVEKVNRNFVFEIGQCSGSYKGKYILIWKRDEDGKWEIFIDSNI